MRRLNVSAESWLQRVSSTAHTTTSQRHPDPSRETCSTAIVAAQSSFFLRCRVSGGVGVRVVAAAETNIVDRNSRAHINVARFSLSFTPGACWRSRTSRRHRQEGRGRPSALCRARQTTSRRQPLGRPSSRRSAAVCRVQQEW